MNSVSSESYNDENMILYEVTEKLHKSHPVLLQVLLLKRFMKNWLF